MAGTGDTEADASAADADYFELTLDGDWLAADLELLLGAVRRVYDAGLTAYLARPGAGVVEQRLERQPPRAFGEAAPAAESQETTLSTEYEEGFFERPRYFQWSPTRRGGVTVFGEISRPSYEGTIRSVRKGLVTLAPQAQLRIRRIAIASPGIVSLQGIGEPMKETGKLIERLTLLNQRRIALRLANANAEQQNEHQAKMNDLEIKREQLKLMEDYLRFLWGDDFRSQAGFQEVIQDVVSGGTELVALIESGRIGAITRED